MKHSLKTAVIRGQWIVSFLTKKDTQITDTVSAY